MDRLIYTAMSGARQFMEQQATVAHNLANVNTTGFKAQFDTFKAVPVGDSEKSLVTQVISETVGSDFTKGNVQQTGRVLDVAIEGDGWLTVQNSQGVEALTRSGNLKIADNGLLQTASGLTVVGEHGPINISGDNQIIIDKDGVVSFVTPPGGSIQTQTIIDRLKLVKVDDQLLIRGGDGLFYNKQAAEYVGSDQDVKVLSGFLESSNVNVVDGMVRMLNMSKQYDMQMEMIKTANTNDSRCGQIMSLS